MKKIIALLLAAALTALSACTAREVQDSSSESQSQSSSESESGSSSVPENSSSAEGQDAPSEPSAGGTSQKVEITLEGEYLQLAPELPEGATGLYRKALGSRYAIFGCPMNNGSTETLLAFDLVDKTWSTVGSCSAEVTSSGQSLVIGDCWYMAYDAGDGVNRLLAVDPAQGKAEYVHTFEGVCSVNWYEALSDHELLMQVNYPIDETIQLQVFDTRDNSCRVLLDIPWSQALLSGMAVWNGKIYLCCSVNGSIEVRIYSAAGELEQTIPIDDLSQKVAAADEVVEGFYLMGERYFFFDTAASGASYLYEHQGGQLEYRELPSPKLTVAGQHGNGLRTAEEDLYYLWDYQTNDLYLFEDGELSRLNLGSGEANVSFLSDVSGNLLLSRFVSGQSIPDYYFIPQSTIAAYAEPVLSMPGMPRT